MKNFLDFCPFLKANFKELVFERKLEDIFEKMKTFEDFQGP